MYCLQHFASLVEADDESLRGMMGFLFCRLIWQLIMWNTGFRRSCNTWLSVLKALDYGISKTTELFFSSFDNQKKLQLWCSHETSISNPLDSHVSFMTGALILRFAQSLSYPIAALLPDELCVVSKHMPAGRWSIMSDFPASDVGQLGVY